MSIFTTAPKSYFSESYTIKPVGKHKLGYTVLAVEVPPDKAYDSIKECWLSGHMAIKGDEFEEMVGKGLIEVTL